MGINFKKLQENGQQYLTKLLGKLLNILENVPLVPNTNQKILQQNLKFVV